MKNITQFCGPGGVVNLVNYQDFCERIAVCQMRHYSLSFSNTIKIPKATPNQVSSSDCLSLLKQEITEIEYKLEPISEIMHYPANGEVIQQHLKNALNNTIQKEIKQFLMKHKLDFQFNVLGIEQLQQMANEYCKRFGRDGYGITFDLNKYQKFFVITSDEDFIYYWTHNRSTLFGKFICLDDTKWIACCYNHAKYLQEAEQNRRFYG